MPFLYFDPVYIYVVMPFVVLAMIASARVKTTFNKYSEQRSRNNITGEEAAKRVLAANGLYNVRVERVSGKLTDHYDPKANVIRLSQSVFDSTSTAAIGVACHEAGHAVQYAQGYGPIKLRAAIIPITNIGSTLAFPLVILGIFLTSISQVYINVALAGIVCFALSTVFQLITLPVEFNASRRALAFVDSSGMLTQEEQKGARKVLTAAAMTYVAALAVSLAQLFRLLLLVNSRRD